LCVGEWGGSKGRWGINMLPDSLHTMVYHEKMKRYNDTVTCVVCSFCCAALTKAQSYVHVYCIRAAAFAKALETLQTYHYDLILYCIDCRMLLTAAPTTT
jgi:hypothetical protein